MGSKEKKSEKENEKNEECRLYYVDSAFMNFARNFDPSTVKKPNYAK